MVPAEQHPGGLSIVVPNYNSSQYLARLLKSLAQTDTSCVSVETLVIDDSSPEEAQAARSLCETYGAILLECKGNVSHKRNVGAAHAVHDLILFVDSDCEASPAVIAEHARLAQLDDHVGAMLGPVEFIGDDTFMWRVVERSQFLGPYAFAYRMEYAPWGGAGNLAVRKQAFQHINGFDTGFLQAPGGEDVDLGLRLNKAGYVIKCNSNALMYHTRETWQSFSRMTRRVFGYGRANYYVMARHPDKLGFEYPQLSVAFLLVLTIGILLSVQHVAIQPFLSSVSYILLVLVIQAILVGLQSTYTLTSVGVTLLAHVLEVIYEAGTLLESLKHGDLRGGYKKIIFAHQQLINERERKIIQMWSLILGFLLLFFVLN